MYRALYELIDICMAAFRRRIFQRQAGHPTPGISGATALAVRRFAMRKDNGLQGSIGADALVRGPQRRPLLLGSLLTLTTMLLLDDPARASKLDQPKLRLRCRMQ